MKLEKFRQNQEEIVEQINKLLDGIDFVLLLTEPHGNKQKNAMLSTVGLSTIKRMLSACLEELDDPSTEPEIGIIRDLTDENSDFKNNINLN